MNAVTYVELASDGMPEDEFNSTGVSNQARKGKTDLQRRALKTCYPTGQKFATRSEHKAFMDFEEKAKGADPDSRVWAAWLSWCVEWAEICNKRTVIMTMPNLLKYMGNEDKRNAWMDKNRAKVLAKPTAAEMKEGMTERMKKAMENKNDPQHAGNQSQ